MKGGQCICHALSEVSKEMKDNDITLDILGEDIVSDYVCENDETDELHIENDCSYTMIAKPFGEVHINKEDGVYFEFEWNGRHKGGIIRVHQFPGTVLYYGGFGIMHRQRCIEKVMGSLNNHWNMSMYSNARLYNSVRVSLTSTILPIRKKPYKTNNG